MSWIKYYDLLACFQGPSVENEDNTLVDGTLIDLCGATLLWRSAEGKVQFRFIQNFKKDMNETYAIHLMR